LLVEESKQNELKEKKRLERQSQIRRGSQRSQENFGENDTSLKENQERPRTIIEELTFRSHKEGLHSFYACFRAITIYSIFYTALSFVGIFYPEFFVCHTMDALIFFPVINELLTMVFRKNWKILFQTVFLAIIFIYVYSMLSFFVFRTDFPDSDCSSFLECFVFVLSNGYRYSGGIGTAMDTVPYGPTAHFIGRVAFDITYFFIVVVIFTAIVSGMIIDAFGAIRDRRAQSKEQLNSKCFVCSIDEATFERHGNGFSKHIHEEHYMWMYLFFAVYLREKKKIRPDTSRVLCEGNVAKARFFFFSYQKDYLLEGCGLR